MAETFLYLTTTGWKTGRSHHIEIWFVEYDGCFYMCSGEREKAHWVQNIQHNPSIEFYVAERGTQPESATAGIGRTLSSETDPNVTAAVSALFNEKYNWSNGLLVEVCPS
jgi:hypothetical protein